MGTFYPPSVYFPNINFNYDFYAIPSNPYQGGGLTLSYANSHYLLSFLRLIVIVLLELIHQQILQVIIRLYLVNLMVMEIILLLVLHSIQLRIFIMFLKLL